VKWIPACAGMFQKKGAYIFKIAFITCERIPALTESEQKFSQFAKQFDIEIEPVVWSSGEKDLNSFDMIVIRTPWDYFLRFEEFSNWLSSLRNIKTPVWNSLDVISKNIHKFYLKDIEADGLKIIPTVFVEKKSKNDLNNVLVNRKWNKAVIKPAISGNAYKTSIVSINEPGIQSKLEELLKDNDVLIQKFIEEIQNGEWSLLFFDKKYSHSALKVPKSGEFRVQSEHGGEYLYKEAPAKLIEQAQKIVDSIKDELLYARVDGIYINETLYLMELELIEPDLFLGTPEAQKNFVNALLERLV
jgi:glutathione synthase/RimK-type ligase-like ATP-grasp enzyme